MAIKLVSRKLTEELRKSGASVTQQNSQVYKNFLNPKTTEDKKFYRMRLLWFADESSSRTTPFVETYNHTVYKRDENNKLDIDHVTCLTSPFLKISNAWAQCPVCQYADSQYKLAKESEWKNKSAMAEKNKLGRRFVAFIPMYVIQDPNQPGNVGQIKIMNLRDKEAYMALTTMVKAAEYEHNVFNMDNAVDLLMSVKQVPQVNLKTGEPRINPHTGEAYTKTEYKFKLSNKPYDLEISTDKLESIDFDASLYTYSSVDELSEFLSRHTVGVNVPDEDISFDMDEPVVPTKPTEPTVTPDLDDDFSFDIGGDEVKPEPVEDDVDDLDLEPVTEKSKEDLASDEVVVDVDDLLDGLDIGDGLDDDDLTF